MKMFKKMMCLGLTMVLIAISLMGCNTMEGAGRDIERGGEEIQDIAD